MVAEEVGFLPSAVLSFEEPRMLKAESFELEAMILRWNVECGMWIWMLGLLKLRCRGEVESAFLLDSKHLLPRIAPPLYKVQYRCKVR